MKVKDGSSASKKERLDSLRQQLGMMQRTLRDDNVPLVIVFEGLDYWGMSDDINDLIRWLDPRGCDFNYMLKPGVEDKERPFICRYFQKMPAKGRIGIFDRSWYFASIYDHYKTKDDARLTRRLNDIRMLERQHHDAGYLIVKFFFDLDGKGRKKKKNSDRCKGKFHLSGEEFIDDLKVAKEEWNQVMLSTDAPYAPWIVIEDDEEADIPTRLLESLIDSVEKAKIGIPSKDGNIRPAQARLKNHSPLDDIDMGLTISNDDYKARLDSLQNELAELQCKMYLKRRPSMIVFEGWDAAGKGGSILRLTASLNPRGYMVAPVTAPNDEELSHHYLWRFYKKVPRDGMMTIFDRSWYGRVLVEKVEGIASPKDVERAYFEINEMEKVMCEHGVVLMKFWLHIDEDEQLRRFKEREDDPEKRWKITEDDWKNRSNWNSYKEAVDEMITRTSTNKVPWTIVPSNDKRYSRVSILNSIVKRF
ncbi:MAG: phosphate--AMP phosphotransferase, partial [Euryarchaeota archaeon]|nr:phosphate--AMP phosphotransferase [Euryarchaeota archaeon]